MPPVELRTHPRMAPRGGACACRRALPGSFGQRAQPLRYIKRRARPGTRVDRAPAIQAVSRAPRKGRGVVYVYDPAVWQCLRGDSRNPLSRNLEAMRRRVPESAAAHDCAHGLPGIVAERLTATAPGRWRLGFRWIWLAGSVDAHRVSPSRPSSAEYVPPLRFAPELAVGAMPLRHSIAPNTAPGDSPVGNEGDSHIPVCAPRLTPPQITSKRFRSGLICLTILVGTA